MDFVRGKRRCPNALEAFVIDLCQFASMCHVAILLTLGWDTGKEIYKGQRKKRRVKGKLYGLRYFAVDAFAIRKVTVT